jgi:hypothetical protein
LPGADSLPSPEVPITWPRLTVSFFLTALVSKNWYQVSRPPSSPCAILIQSPLTDFTLPDSTAYTLLPLSTTKSRPLWVSLPSSSQPWSAEVLSVGQAIDDSVAAVGVQAAAVSIPLITPTSIAITSRSGRRNMSMTPPITGIALLSPTLCSLLCLCPDDRAEGRPLSQRLPENQVIMSRVIHRLTADRPD